MHRGATRTAEEAGKCSGTQMHAQLLGLQAPGGTGSGEEVLRTTGSTQGCHPIYRQLGEWGQEMLGRLDMRCELCCAGRTQATAPGWG